MKTVCVDDDGSGQRLDNFLLRRLKGVPKTHVYRLIRSGEVRVNKGRASADTRLQPGDLVRIPPVRISERVAEKSAAMAEQVARAVPARDFAGQRPNFWNWCTGWTATPAASCWWPRNAAR